MNLPIFKREEDYYRGVGFSNIFYVGENVEKNEKNIEKIWNHVVSISWDNANDLGIRELEMGNCKESEWEKVADTFFGPSLEGIIDNIRSN